MSSKPNRRVSFCSYFICKFIDKKNINIIHQEHCIKYNSPYVTLAGMLSILGDFQVINFDLKKCTIKKYTTINDNFIIA